MEQGKEAPQGAGLSEVIGLMNCWISEALEIRKQCNDLVEAATRSALSINVCDAVIPDFNCEDFYTRAFPKKYDQ